MCYVWDVGLGTWRARLIGEWLTQCFTKGLPWSDGFLKILQVVASNTGSNSVILIAFRSPDYMAWPNVCRYNLALVGSRTRGVSQARR